MTTRRAVLAGLGALGAAACAPAALRGIGGAQGPNIVMISVDDLNDWIGAMGGNPGAKTPHIDRLAARGTLFSNAHAQAPLCGPSRASLMTGMQPSATGIYGHIDDEDIRIAGPATANVTFLPERMRQAGYRTMGIGKLFHIGAPDGVFDEFGGRHPGFGPRPAERFQWDRKGTSTDWGAYPAADEEMPDTRSARWAAERLGRAYDDLFFLAVGFLRPHVPWYVPQKWFDLHPLDDIVLPPYLAEDWQDVPQMARSISEIPPMPPMDWVLANDQWPAIVQAYLASVSFVDHCIGLVLNALENGPHAESTVVVLWSDHGYHLGEKGLFQKFTLWDRSTRVPLIFAGPGVTAGQDRSEPVGLIDIYPTLTSIAGGQAGDQATGIDLSDALRGASANPDAAVLTTYGPGNHAIRTSRYRYIRYEDGSEELYDHRSDPNEWSNLASDPKMREVIEGLKARLPAEEASWSPKSQIRLNPFFNETYKN